jgi:hypothetical protein
MLRQPPGEGAAKSGAVDSDLQLIINSWESLPSAIRVGILAMVRSANS